MFQTEFTANKLIQKTSSFFQSDEFYKKKSEIEQKWAKTGYLKRLNNWFTFETKTIKRLMKNLKNFCFYFILSTLLYSEKLD